MAWHNCAVADCNYIIIHSLLQESQDRAHHLLRQYSVEHNRLAEALLKYETLTLEEIKLVIAGKVLSRKL